RSNIKSVIFEESQLSQNQASNDDDPDAISDVMSDSDTETNENEPRSTALKLLRSVSTRWLSQGMAVTRVVRVYEPLIRALDRLEDLGDFTAAGHKAFMLQRSTIA
ncbi:hypothetical protein FOL47_006382, partial [Perkinsus chesapeaki]